jgi:hypothetical protein
MGVSFGEVVGDVQPDEENATKPARQKPHVQQLEAIVLEREIARLQRRDARLRAT